VNARDRGCVIPGDGSGDRHGGAVRAVRLETVVGTLATPGLLSILSVTAGLGVAGWVTGLVAGWGVTALLAAARVRSAQPVTSPADWVTLSRAVLAAGIASLVADSFVRPAPVTALVVLASVALALDAVDGQMARRTATASRVGARFDAEVGSFLILLLSVAVSRDYGGWVLAIGAARYALLAAGWVLPWLAAPLPPRYWRRVVAAVQGIVLTVAVSGLLPRPVGMITVGVALVLLAESFGRDVIWLYRAGAGPRTRRTLRRATALVAALVVWAVLVVPDRLSQLTPAAFIRIPIEGLVLVGMGLLLPARPRRAVAAVLGVAFGLVAVFTVLNMAFYEELNRPFDPTLDWSNLRPALGVVRDSIGVATDVLLIMVGVVLVLTVAAVCMSAVRVSTVTARHRRGSARAVVLVGVLWVLCAALSWQLVPGVPIASRSTVAQASSLGATLRDRQLFESRLHSADPYAKVPASQLLTGLRGKDVLVAFVESYGQVAVQGTSFSPGVDAVLHSSTATLAGAGYSARSAFLTSPTFGGVSWLAHSTLQSGLRVDNTRSYDQLVHSDRFTLSDAFGKAGWRTVSDIPSNDQTWPEGTSFYHYDRLYDRRDVGYHGPNFSYAQIPDQYTLAAFQRLELSQGHRPVMAEIDLDSSHWPWTPLPRMVPWNQLGDGSIFDPMPAQGLSPGVAWRDTSTVRRLYGQSIQYSLQALISWVIRLHDDNLVLVMLGDHQPATTVSGPDANHRVPVSIVAHDPAVLSQVASWHWQDGLLPASTAPVWPMDAFRNRFLGAFHTAQPGR
jgi:phosphatidylglycerophosphate synthase